MNCSICFDALGVQNEYNGGATVISCGHVFHRSCIKEWIRTSGSRRCPVCRKYIQKCCRYRKIYLTGSETSESCLKCEELENKCEELEKANHGHQAIRLRLSHELESALGENKMMRMMIDEISESNKDAWRKLKVERERTDSALSELKDLQKRYDADILLDSEGEIFLQLKAERERACKAEAEAEEKQKSHDKLHQDFEKAKLKMHEEHQLSLEELSKLKSEIGVATGKAEDIQELYDNLLEAHKELQLQKETEKSKALTAALTMQLCYEILSDLTADYQNLEEEYDLLKSQVSVVAEQGTQTSDADQDRIHRNNKISKFSLSVLYIITNLVDSRISEHLLMGSNL